MYRNQKIQKVHKKMQRKTCTKTNLIINRKSENKTKREKNDMSTSEDKLNKWQLYQYGLKQNFFLESESFLIAIQMNALRVKYMKNKLEKI